MKQLLPMLATLCCIAGCQSAGIPLPLASRPPVQYPLSPYESHAASLAATDAKLKEVDQQIVALRARPVADSPYTQDLPPVRLAAMQQTNNGSQAGSDAARAIPVFQQPVVSPPSDFEQAAIAAEEAVKALRTESTSSSAAETSAPATPTEPARLPAPDLAAPTLAQPAVPATVQPPEIVETAPLDLAPDDPAAGYNLAAFEQMALANNPTYAQHAARLQALRGKWVQVGLSPNPNVGYTGEDIGVGGTAGQHGAFVSQQFVRGDKLQLNRQVATRQIAQASNQLAAQQQRILTDVRIRFYNVLIAQQKQQISLELVAVGERSVVAAQKLLRAKEINRIQVLQAQVETDNLRLLADQAANETEAAWRQLEAVTGAGALSRMPLQGDMNISPATIVWGDKLNDLLATSPELAAAHAEVQRARASYQRAVAEPVSDITGRLAVKHDASSDTAVVDVQIGLPLPLWNQNQGRIRQTRQEIAVAQRDVERLRLNLKQRMASVYRDYVNAELQVTRYARDILPRATETLKLVNEGYSVGQTDYLTLLTAQRTFFNTRLAQIEARRTLWTTTAQMQGLLLSNSLQQQASSQN